MKFQKTERWEPTGFSDRAKSAWLAKPQRQRQKLEKAYPLIADLFDTSLPHSIETEEEKRMAMQIKTERDFRNREAMAWRKARSMYFALPQEQRQEVKRRMDRWWGPVKSSCLYYLVREVNGENERIRQAHLAYERELRRRIAQDMNAAPFLPFAGDAA